MQTLRLTIEGMNCGHCAARLRQKLQQLPGVQVQQVQVGSAQLIVDPARTSSSTIHDAIHDAGYTVAQSYQ